MLLDSDPLSYLWKSGRNEAVQLVVESAPL